MKKLITVALIALIPSLATAKPSPDTVCDQLISDIVKYYDVQNLEWARNGNPYVSESMVSCVYRATRRSMSGDLPVMVIALLNTSNNNFTVEFR